VKEPVGGDRRRDPARHIRVVAGSTTACRSAAGAGGGIVGGVVYLHRHGRPGHGLVGGRRDIDVVDVAVLVVVDVGERRRWHGRGITGTYGPPAAVVAVVKGGEFVAVLPGGAVSADGQP